MERKLQLSKFKMNTQALLFSLVLMLATGVTKSMSTSTSSIKPVHHSTSIVHHQCNHPLKSGQLMNNVVPALPLPFDQTVRVSVDNIHQIRIMSLPVRYQPTYRLASKVPYKKEECEKVIKFILDTAMETFVYEPDEAEALCKTLSTEILTKVKKLNFDRYKLVCVVTIGEKYMQSFCDLFKCLWDMQKDGYAFYVYDTPSVFAIAILYAVYCN